MKAVWGLGHGCPAQVFQLLIQHSIDSACSYLLILQCYRVTAVLNSCSKSPVQYLVGKLQDVNVLYLVVLERMMQLTALPTAIKTSLGSFPSKFIME